MSLHPRCSSTSSICAAIHVVHAHVKRTHTRVTKRSCLLQTEDNVPSTIDTAQARGCAQASLLRQGLRSFLERMSLSSRAAHWRRKTQEHVVLPAHNPDAADSYAAQLRSEAPLLCLTAPFLSAGPIHTYLT